MAWGGKREGAGRKANPKRERQVAKIKLDQDKPSLTVPAEPKKLADLVMSPTDWAAALRDIEEISKQYARTKAKSQAVNPFRFPHFPKQAVPPDPKLTMAQDSALKLAMDDWSGNWGSGEILGSLPAEGLLFLGYTYLAELAQRPEYRTMSETIADDATRRWLDFDVTGDEQQNKADQAKDPEGFAERMADPDQRKKRLAAAGKLDKVKELKDDQERLQVRQKFYEQCRNDGFFGRSHLYLDIRTDSGWTEVPDEELKVDIGDGRSGLSRSKCPKGAFYKLKTIEPVWTYPLAYNANDPLRDDWYNPQVWYVMGKEIHSSRIPCFIGHPVPDMLKPAYAFGGLSLSQMAKPYVDIWLQTRQSVADLIKSFSVMVLMTDLSTMLQPGAAGALIARIAMFNMFRDNQGAFVANKTTEDVKNVSAPLGSLDKLQAQSQEHMAAVSRLPLVKMTGISPTGLNATSEFEIEVYDDTIAAYQQRFMDVNARKVINFEHLHLWGEVDPEITHRWETLRELSDAERGQKQKDDADRDQKYVDMGAIGPDEVRKRIINDKDLPYTGLNPDDLPPPPAAEGMLGPGGGGAAAAFEKNNVGAPQGKGEGAEDGAIPFAQDADFREDQHPRDQGGKFSAGGSTPTSPSESLTAAAAKTRVTPAVAAAEASQGAFRDADRKAAAVVKHIRKLHDLRDAISETDMPDGYTTLEDLNFEEGGDIDLIIDGAREAARTKVKDDQIAPELDPEERNLLSEPEQQQFDMIGQRLKGLYAMAKERSRDLAKAAVAYKRSLKTAGDRIEALTEQAADLPRKDWEPWMIAAETLGRQDDVNATAAIVDYLSGKPLSEKQAGFIEDLVDEFRATEEFEALPPEEQRKILAEQEKAEQEKDAQHTAEVNSKVDDAIRAGWWPTIEDGIIKLGRNIPPELQPYASPSSLRKIKDRFAQHLMGQIKRSGQAHDSDPEFRESDHPRDDAGKFTAGSGGGKSSTKKSPYAAMKPEDLVKHLVGKPVIAGSNYRRALTQAIKTASDEEKKVLTSNLIASWEKTRANHVAKGDGDTAEKIAAKIAKLGGKPVEPKKQTAAWAKSGKASASLTRFRETAREDLIAYGKANDQENLEVFDLKTGKPLEADELISTRGARNVQFSEKLTEMLADPETEIELHHNHPSDVSFSGQDILMIEKYPTMKRIYAHGHRESTYSVDAANKGAFGAYRAATVDVHAYLSAQLSTNLLVDDCVAIQAHAVMTALDRAKVVTNYQAVLGWNAAEIMETHAEHFEKAVNVAISRINVLIKAGKI